MKEYFEILKLNSLFENIDDKSLSSMLSCLGAHKKSYTKDETVIFVGDKMQCVGFVLSGSVNISRTDFEGNETIIASIMSGDMFAEVFACAGIELSPVCVTANSGSEIMFIDFQRIITTCGRCTFHGQLISNMLKVIATKNLILNQKIDILSKKTLREKILCYFEYFRMGKREFDVPFNREQMANYLCADRSALSGELSKMSREGIISYKKNSFEIL